MGILPIYPNLMAITKKDTRNLVQAVVKALDPKFKKIDKQFEDRNIEIGDMIALLATKQELVALEIKDINQRLDDAEEKFNDFTADAASFESKVVTAFTHVEEQFKDLKQLIKQGHQHVGTHSEKLRKHETRILNLEKAVLN